MEREGAGREVRNLYKLLIVRCPIYKVSILYEWVLLHGSVVHSDNFCLKFGKWFEIENLAIKIKRGEREIGMKHKILWFAKKSG